MALIADRFLQNGTDQVLDLATGELAWLRMFAAGGQTDEARWQRRCAQLASLRHPALAVLLDYGAIGEGRRFEVWRTEGEWQRDRADAADAVRQARAFLRCVDMPAGVRLRPHRLGASAVCVVDDAEEGSEEFAAQFEVQPAGAMRLRHGIELLPRASVRAFAERVSSLDGHGPRVFSMWAPAGAGRHTALLEIARAVRMQGIVPLALSAWPCRDALGPDRTFALLAIDDATAAWQTFLDLTVASRRPHLLVVAGEAEMPHAQAMPLERFSVEQLVAAIRPQPSAAEWRESIAQARRADGWPGRFARRVLVEAASAGRAPAAAARASEERAQYGNEPAEASVPPRMWPISADIVPLRQRQEEAMALLGAGRHVRGERLLRQALGGLSRRADWAHAAEGAIALGSGLAGRGRGREAIAAFDDARRFAARAKQPELQLTISTLVGRSEVDALHLDEAESVLESGLAAARALRAPRAEAALSLELSRCLFWRGRYEAAGTLLDRREPPADLAAPVAMERSRIALGRGLVAEAVASAMLGVTLAGKSESAGPRAAAAAVAALAHLAVGDHAAVERDIASGLDAARTAHQPLAALRLRVLQAEHWRRSGQRAAAARLLHRLRRRGSQQIPAIVTARIELAEQLLRDEAPVTALRLATRTGLVSLTLFAPKSPAAGPRASLHHVVEILRCCQTAEDDAQILKTLVGRLREALNASGVSLYADDRGQLVPVASEGARIEREAAERVRALGDALGPRPGAPSGDGGVPVRYADRVIGVIVVRWPMPERCDARESVELLTTAAVAAGPALAAEQVRRLQKPAGVVELLGPSDAMERVRAGIERAAPAPFSVLVEGESGTGKELVARAIHRRSTRRERTCCTVNCAALPDDLVESELFGHARGAFTGAMAERPGVFDEAHGGTLFLDEIGELSLRAQAKVLRAIQEGEVRRVGENTPRRVDVRIIAATNRDLRQEVAAGRFRLDLLYRLDVIRVSVPPLRDRIEDLPVLAEHFWRDATARIGSRASLSVTTIAALARYHWPGNVRELQNVLAALAVRCPRRGIVPPSALPAVFDGCERDVSWRLDAARRTFEASFVRAALARAGGHRLRAAEELGVTRQGLAKLMTRLGLADIERATARRD